MTINSPIIDAGPTISRADVRTVVCPLIEPFVSTTTEFGTLSIVDGSITYLTYRPEWHGQMIFTLVPAEKQVVIYIAIEVDGDLTWKEVSVGLVYEDPRTDEEKDPNYDLYFS